MHDRWPFGALIAGAGGRLAAIVAVATCASFGGIPRPAESDGGGTSDLVSDVPLVERVGLPPNGDNIGATIAHWLSLGGLPAADELGLLLFAYGDRIHDHCDRRAFRRGPVRAGIR